MAATLEVLPLGGGGRHRRCCPDGGEGADRGGDATSGCDCERGRGTARAAGQPSVILALARPSGKLVLPAPEGPVEFAAMIVVPLGEGPRPSEAIGPEIMVGGVTISLEAGAPAERIAAIVRALSAGP